MVNFKVKDYKAFAKVIKDKEDEKTAASANTSVASSSAQTVSPKSVIFYHPKQQTWQFAKGAADVPKVKNDKGNVK